MWAIQWTSHNSLADSLAYRAKSNTIVETKTSVSGSTYQSGKRGLSAKALALETKFVSAKSGEAVLNR